MVLGKRILVLFHTGGYHDHANLRDNRTFVHGQTYQGHPIACAAALEVQKIVKEEKLVENVQVMGKLLTKRLSELLSNHPNVGDIRGRGLFWGIEFVADKTARRPFSVENNVAMGIAELGLTEPYGIAVYPGTGTVDGINGDHVIISPAYNSTAADIEEMVKIMQRLVTDYFEKKA
jgi:adenosylmethionine-8-amino-7-oxononanoate aminotransferase